jgi:hypothetical protein
MKTSIKTLLTMAALFGNACYGGPWLSKANPCSVSPVSTPRSDASMVVSEAWSNDFAPARTPRDISLPSSEISTPRSMACSEFIHQDHDLSPSIGLTASKDLSAAIRMAIQSSRPETTNQSTMTDSHPSSSSRMNNRLSNSRFDENFPSPR